MPTHQRQHGFTIVELIVTMSILGLMLFLVNQLFNDTSVAVQTSVQTSKTIATSRSINEQLSADMDAMVGPGLAANGGYIVVIQQRLPNVAMIDPQTLTEVTVDELRIDQLLFVRDGEGVKSMTPSTANSYNTNFVGQPGDRATVWYGQALRTQPNGEPVTGTDANLGGADAGLDRVGNNFIFGRQAMLFNPTNIATSSKLSDASAGFTYAANGYYGAAVSNVTGFTGTALTYKGLTDITIQDYGPSSTAGTLLYQLSDASQAANHNTNYISTAYPVAANRLRVNTAPDATATNYASWSIAQGHPILAQGCSEIIIDFAADLNGNGRIDRQIGGGNDTTGAIYWYDTLRRELPAPTINDYRWSNNIVTEPLLNTTLGGDQNIFVFRVDDDQPHPGPIGTPANNSSWPYMIRIRYRLHDTRGRLTGNYAYAGRDFLDNNGDGNPDESGEDRISGRWFERIIAVPRP